jgi:hypothetical protein
MEYISEIDLNKRVDHATQEMLKSWHDYCLDRIGNNLQVVVADRRLNAALVNQPGFNTAFPYKIDEDLCLVLWLDSVQTLDSILITHELGHWLLKLQGFKAFTNTHNPYGEIVTSLNSLAQHPALYKLQRSFGHDPQAMIDSKTNQDTSSFSNEPEGRSELWAMDSLLAADDILNSSEVFRQPIEPLLVLPISVFL